ncbi:MAG: RluA family pseudouridine synthase [Myxococcota bacterium]|nr:RluA family pseudouridine synthase [Myxococcota bacterium]
MVESVYEYEVSPAEAGRRLDVYLAGRGLPWSRSQIRRRIEEGEVLVDDAPGRPAQRLRSGQRVRFCPAPPRQPRDLPEPIPLSVLYEDPHLIVIDKPAGLVVHPAPGHEQGTLVNALLHHCGTLPDPPRRPISSDPEEDDVALGGLCTSGERRPGIVHRLDQGTSGVLVCAKDELTLIGLQAQFAAHRIQRRYLAVVEGSPPDTGTFCTPYGRHPTDRRRFTGRAGPRRAVTHFAVAERLPGAALLRIELETGRTHQIRVHLSEAGYPVLGDPLYGRSRSPRLRELGRALGRQALHAEMLGFVHPILGRPMSWTAPLPADLAELLRRLRGEAP